MTPRVEVVVPVFDGARHLTAAVERIEAQGVARLGHAGTGRYPDP